VDHQTVPLKNQHLRLYFHGRTETVSDIPLLFAMLETILLPHPCPLLVSTFTANRIQTKTVCKGRHGNSVSDFWSVPEQKIPMPCS
jgi:hypothetical protein